MERKGGIGRRERIGQEKGRERGTERGGQHDGAAPLVMHVNKVGVMCFMVQILAGPGFTGRNVRWRWRLRVYATRDNAYH